MGSAAPVLASPPIAPALFGHYEGLEDPVVIGFLAGHPRLVPVLVTAIPEVERIFGADTRIVLRPETEHSGALTLYAIILADRSLSVDEQFALLCRFDDWWLEQDRGGGPLCFDVGDA